MRSNGKLAAFFLAVLLCVLTGCSAIEPFDSVSDWLRLSGWHQSQDGAYKYMDKLGRPMTGWVDIDTSRYYFDPDNDGAMVCGWLDDGGERYYLDTDGKLYTGWLELNDTRYYLSEDGHMVTGWLTLEDDNYYLLADGTLATGWVELDGKRYFLDSNGIRQTGWLQTDAGRFCLDDDGVMLTGWLETDEGRCYLGEDGIMLTGWLETDEGRYYLGEDGIAAAGWVTLEETLYYLDENGKVHTGWLEDNGLRYYFSEEGTLTTGWASIDEARYYFDGSGVMQTGWLNYEENYYYLRSDGTMAVGEVVIDGVSSFFTSQGKYVILVNRWNPVPDWYSPNLVSYQGELVEQSCLEPLKQMLNACKANGHSYSIDSVYRSVSLQTTLFNRRYKARLAEGYSEEEAYELVALGTAIPGTSEHHLGLAVDISIGGSEALHKWLRQHSWEYGFIVRYPEGTTDYTGIKYEPWHFRYVGKELARELYELDMCMEEYMQMLTAANEQ